VVGPMMVRGDDALAPIQARVAQLEEQARKQSGVPVDPGKQERVQQAATSAAIRKMIDEDLRADLSALRAEMAGVRGELAKEDARTDKRLTRLEGQIDEIVKTLTARAGDPPVRRAPERGGGTDETPDPPVDVVPPTEDDSPVDTVPQVDPAVATLCKQLLESKEDGERFPAANELGRLADEAAIPALAYALVNDEHFLVRRACARSLNMLKAWYATPALIEALEDKEAYVAQQANFALRTITGEDFQVTQEQSSSERGSPPTGVSVHSAELVK
jgi:hypothetical protein